MVPVIRCGLIVADSFVVVPFGQLGLCQALGLFNPIAAENNRGQTPSVRIGVAPSRAPEADSSGNQLGADPASVRGPRLQIVDLAGQRDPIRLNSRFPPPSAPAI